MPIALHPGSFDPPTLGHLDLVTRGRKLFERLHVVVAFNSRKTPLFTTVFLRGLRQVGDFEAEQSIALMNRRLAPQIETVYLPCREEHLGLTSTLVRDIARLGGDVSPFVPPPVAQALRERFQGKS